MPKVDNQERMRRVEQSLSDKRRREEQIEKENQRMLDLATKGSDGTPMGIAKKLAELKIKKEEEPIRHEAWLEMRRQNSMVVDKVGDFEIRYIKK